MNLIVRRMGLLKLSTSLICAKSEVEIKCHPDMEDVKLGKTMCGNSSLAADYIWSHTSWHEGIYCVSFCKHKMKKNEWEEACCQAEVTDPDFKITHCLVREKVDVVEHIQFNRLEKAVKCTVETSTTETTSTSNFTSSTTTTSATSIIKTTSFNGTATNGIETESSKKRVLTTKPTTKPNPDDFGPPPKPWVFGFAVKTQVEAHVMMLSIVSLFQLMT